MESLHLLGGSAGLSVVGSQKTPTALVDQDLNQNHRCKIRFCTVSVADPLIRTD